MKTETPAQKNPLLPYPQRKTARERPDLTTTHCSRRAPWCRAQTPAPVARMHGVKARAQFRDATQRKPRIVTAARNVTPDLRTFRVGSAGNGLLKPHLRRKQHGHDFEKYCDLYEANTPAIHILAGVSLRLDANRPGLSKLVGLNITFTFILQITVSIERNSASNLND